MRTETLMNSTRKLSNAYGDHSKVKAMQSRRGFQSPSMREDGRKRDSVKRASKVVTYTLSPEELASL